MSTSDNYKINTLLSKVTLLSFGILSYHSIIIVSLKVASLRCSLNIEFNCVERKEEYCELRINITWWPLFNCPSQWNGKYVLEHHYSLLYKEKFFAAIGVMWRDQSQSQCQVTLWKCYGRVIGEYLNINFSSLVCGLVG